MAGLRPRNPNAGPDLELGDGGGRDLEIDIPGKAAPPKAAPSIDLDLPAAPQAPAPAVPAAQPSGRSMLDEMDDDDHLMSGSGMSLELDTSGGAALPPGVSQPSIPVAPPAPISQRSLPPAPVSQWSLPPAGAAPVSGSFPPAGRASIPSPVQEAAPLEVDPFEARALVDYEPPPDAFWMTPMYAYRVLTRRAEVVREAAQAKADAEAARTRAEDAMIALAERLRPQMEAQGGRGLDAVVAAETVLRSRDGALAAELDAQRARQAQGDAQMAALDGELAAVRAQAESVRREVDAARTVRDRVEATLKRADIEARNATSVRAATPGVEFDVVAVQSKLAEHVAERETRAAELARATAALTTAEQRAAATERQVAELEAKASAARAARKAAEDRAQRQLTTRGAGADDARNRYRTALADVARAALGSATVPPELDAFQKDAVRADQDAHTKAVRARLYEVGVDQFERGKVGLGIGLAVGVVAVLLLLLLFPFIYRAIVVD